MSTGIRQTINYPCPTCGSRYRVGDYCNKCEAFAPVPPEPPDPSFSREGKQPRGQLWDEKQKKVVYTH